MAISKQLLSGSTQGKGIKVVATATAGTTVHATGTSATTIDEIWLWAWNTDTVSRLLTIEFGGVTDPDNLLEITISPSSEDPKLVIPGWVLVGTGAAANTIAAFAAAANVILLYGYVNRIVP